MRPLAFAGFGFVGALVVYAVGNAAGDTFTDAAFPVLLVGTLLATAAVPVLGNRSPRLASWTGAFWLGVLLATYLFAVLVVQPGDSSRFVEIGLLMTIYAAPIVAGLLFLRGFRRVSSVVAVSATIAMALVAVWFAIYARSDPENVSLLTFAILGAYVLASLGVALMPLGRPKTA